MVLGERECNIKEREENPRKGKRDENEKATTANRYVPTSYIYIRSIVPRQNVPDIIYYLYIKEVSSGFLTFQSFISCTGLSCAHPCEKINK